MASRLLIYFTFITGLKIKNRQLNRISLHQRMSQIHIKYSNLRRFSTLTYLQLNKFTTTLINEPIFNTLSVVRKLKKTALVRIPGAKGVFRISTLRRGQNTVIQTTFMLKWSCRSRQHQYLENNILIACPVMLACNVLELFGRQGPLFIQTYLFVSFLLYFWCVISLLVLVLLCSIIIFQLLQCPLIVIGSLILYNDIILISFMIMFALFLIPM